jgi:hypothetical protein
VPVADEFLDLVGHVRDHLHGAAEVVAAALLGDHVSVDLPVVTLFEPRRFTR